MVSSACTFATVSTVIQWNAFAWNIENINIIILTKMIIIIMTLSSPKWSSYYNDIVITKMIIILSWHYHHQCTWVKAGMRLANIVTSFAFWGRTECFWFSKKTLPHIRWWWKCWSWWWRCLWWCWWCPIIFSPMTWASHSCRDWKGNLLPQPIPQTHSCVPFVGDNDNVDVDDDTDLSLPWCVGTILHPSLLPSSLQELT